MESVRRVRKTDLARNTHQVIRTVQRGQTAVIESHGRPEVAIQYAQKGIRVNSVSPGLMKTPRIARYYTDAWDGMVDEMWEKRDAMSPTGKQGDAWDIAYAVLYLASDEAKYITGTNLVVDGGLTGTISQGARK